jgi:small subunit ribosomal protein S14
MAKKSMLEREKKRKTLVLKYVEKRKALLNELKKAGSLEEIFSLNEKLQKLPRNSSPVRVRNRCWKTGRPRGYFRYFGLCRNALRELANDCFLPGITKASW